jgi:hypothetical protein
MEFKMIVISEQNYSIYSNKTTDDKKNTQLIVSPKLGKTIIHSNGKTKSIKVKDKK